MKEFGMRHPSMLYVGLVALLVASVALAAKPQTATANLSSLEASGISGTADFRVDQQGNAKVHEQLTGLTPGVQYESVIFLDSATCGSGAVTAVVMTFTPNPSGRANINADVPPQAVPAIAGGASISVQRVSD